MDIVKLKEGIENNKIDSSFKVWVAKDKSSYIIINQYIRLLASNLNLEIKFIDSINDIPDQSFIEDTNLYVLKLEKNTINDIIDRCIVICEENKINYNKDVITEFPKLEDWQVVDFSLAKVTGLDKTTLEWLISLYNGKYYNYINDLNKISIFEESQQKILFDQMLKDGLFDYVSNLTIWDLSNAILKKDLRIIREVLKYKEYLDISPLALATTLYKNFKTVACIQLNSDISANELGISDKQLFVIKKYNCGYYSNECIINIMALLTNVEYLYKYCGLPIDYLLDYIIVKILGV